MRHILFIAHAALTLLTGTAQAQDSSPVRIGWRDHPFVELGSVRLELKARLESDRHLATPAVGRDHPESLWQSPRVEVGGQIGRRVDFELSRDFGDDSAWKDAYVSLRLTRALEIDAGRFKVPFGRETLVGRANLDFIHRSLGASQLAPSRDTGLMAHGRVLRRRLTYEAGYFHRDGDNARTNQTLGARGTVALRVVATPFAGGSSTPRSQLHIAIAVAESRLDNRLGLRGQTLLKDGVFFDRVYVNGRRRRVGLEGFWSAGPASLGGEYMLVSDERNEMGLWGDDLPAVRASAWYVAGTWAVTGEKKKGRLEPRRAFGAVELVARIEELRFDAVSHPGVQFGFPNPSTLLGNTDLMTTVGVNLYLHRHVRVQYNHVIESIADPQRSPAPTSRGRFTTGVLRAQFTI